MVIENIKLSLNIINNIILGQVIASCGNDGKIVLSHAGKGS